MTARVCLACTTVFAVGLAGCPHCGGSAHVEQGGDMPKITKHGGPSHAGALPPAGDVQEEREHPGTGVPMTAIEVPADGVEREHVLDGTEGGEQPSAGSSTATSSEKPSTSSAQNKPERRSRARTAESPSSPGRPGNSTAGSTGTPGRATAADR